MSDLHSKLKAATAEIHRQLEMGGAAANLMSAELDVDGYLKYLKALYAFVAPLEESLRSSPEVQKYLPDFAKRMKSAWLEADIRALGASADGQGHATQAQLPPTAGLGEAIGVMYVMEGSTLGGQLIRKSLLKHQFINTGNLNYIGAYGEKTGAMWRELLDGLARFGAAEPQAEAAAVEAAVSTFKRLGEWFKSPSRA